MNVICMNNRDNYPPLVLPIDQKSNISDNRFVSNKEWFTVDKNVIGYNIEIGCKYEVYGILFFTDQIRYLIQDDRGMPGFFPESLFQIETRDIFFDWKIAQYSVCTGDLFFVGFPELSDGYERLRDLVDQKNDAIFRFLQYKQYVSGISIA